MQPTGDDLAASLNAYRIGYVLLQGGAGAQSALAEARGALGANPLLSVVSTTADGTLYRFDDLRTTGPIRLQIGVDETITDLEFRAWLDWAEYMELDSLAMVRTAPRSRG